MWTTHPYRLLFLLAVPLAWAGILPWFLVGVGAVEGYPSVFHSIAQIQGLMSTLAAGFLLTAIPRRTGTAPPSPWLVGLCALAPAATVALAAAEHLGPSQGPWLAMVVGLIAFAWRRFHAAEAGRRPPDSFVWIPLALGTGVAGSLLIGAYGMGGEVWFSLHQVGKLMLLQGMFAGLVVGVGGMALPLITRGEGAIDGTPAGAGVRWLHRALALGLVATFVLEVYGPETLANRATSHALRGVLLLVTLIWVARIHRPPSRPGAQRRLVWIAAWCLPLGYLLAAALPERPHAGLHVVFVGGFASLALAVALHVIWSHDPRKKGGDPRAHGGSPGAVLLGVALLAAVVARSLMLLDPARTLPWMAVSSGSFLSATLIWLGLTWRALVSR